MKLPDIFKAIKDAVVRAPKTLWILVLVLLGTVLLLNVYLAKTSPVGDKPAQQEQRSSPTPGDSDKKSEINADSGAARPPAKVPPRLRDFLIGAVVASFILAAFISLNRREVDGKMRYTFLIGSMISVVSIALIVASFHLYDEEPGNKTVFLIAANFVAISLLVLAVCYVPKTIRALQGIRSTFLKITALLCLAGAAGGLAYHLDHNGSLVLPDLGFVDVERATRSDGPAVKDTEVDTAAAKSAVAPPSVNPPSRDKVKRRAFHIGFFGDILLGLITANALHLAIASLVRYDAKDQDRPGQYFTFLALGILGGFAGTTFLSAQAEKVAKSDVREIVREEVGQGPKLAESGEQILALPKATETAAAVTDALTRFEWPTDAELDLMKTFASVARDSKKPLERFSTDELIAAAGSDLFLNTIAGSETTKKYVGLVINKANVPRAQGWTARMLRVLSVTCEGTRLSKGGWYAEAKTDLSQLSFDAASGDQRSSGAILANLTTLAAVINYELEQPEWDRFGRRLELGKASGNVKAKKAAELTAEVAAYIREKAVPSASLESPSRPATVEGPAANDGPGSVAQTSVPSASPTPTASPIPPQPTGTAEERLALFRLVAAMRAVPKQLFEKFAKGSDADRTALSPFIDAAPSYPHKTRNSSTAPARNAPPTATPTPVANPPGALPDQSPHPAGTPPASPTPQDG